MKEWGSLKVIEIKEGCDFWAIISELIDDDSGFLHNKDFIAESYREGTLYGLQVTENQWMFDNHAREDKLFMRNDDGTLSWYLLPCFCVIKKFYCKYNMGSY